MSMIEDIKRDREAGTDTRWKLRMFNSKYFNIFTKTGPVISHYEYEGMSLGRHNAVENEANSRRIARVPDMEAALIAAEEMAGAYETYASRANADMPEDWAAMDIALAAFRAATGAA